ncbi:MAG TPA: CAP domain-containing protein [Saprospiraceae bacterium]|nr:CAP domain-containing protein [Saprospiraceae bacterium]
MSLPFLLLSMACSFPFGDGSLSEPAVEKMAEEDLQDREIMLALVNDIRKNGCQCGRRYMPPTSPLNLQVQLNEAAQKHAADMYDQQFFRHRGSDGSRVGDRAEQAGYSWTTIGENISAGYTDVQAAFDSWRTSPDHCINMMGKHFQDMGLGQKGNYWVQTLGTKSN